MDIIKYKKMKSGKYKVEFSNNKSLELYEEVILKFGLLLKPNITSQLILDITSYNEECEVYYQALKLIKTKSRTIKEVKEVLIKKEYPEALVLMAIHKLISQKYLDDQFYAKAYVHNGIVTSKGPYKIINELEKKGVEKAAIYEAMEQYTKELETEIITKKIKKMIASNHNKSNVMLQKKIVTDLINQGFKKELISTMLSEQKLQDDHTIIEKEYEKLYQKLSKKYTGKELELKIKQKMYQKGMYYNYE